VDATTAAISWTFSVRPPTDVMSFIRHQCNEPTVTHTTTRPYHARAVSSWSPHHRAPCIRVTCEHVAFGPDHLALQRPPGRNSDEEWIGHAGRRNIGTRTHNWKGSTDGDRSGCAL
jgi:hypothetical protein